MYLEIGFDGKFLALNFLCNYNFLSSYAHLDTQLTVKYTDRLKFK
jgi:hypothetical protein